MGAQACSGQENCGTACCNAPKDHRPDALPEYEPYPKAEAHREYEEPSPPRAVMNKNAGSGDSGSRPMEFGSRQTEDSGGNPNNGAPLPDPDQLDGDESGGESYFARELQELRQQPSDGHVGPRSKYTFKTGATYLGQWKGNARHGIGVQTWLDGAKFTGEWRESVAEGLGRFMHADGDIFVGQWRSNAAQGLGTYYHRKGQTTYRGQWVEDLQHGHGVEQWEGGSRYSGQFVWGKKQGHGVYEWPDGSIYRGEWQANSINGFGHYIGRDGREFKGMWRGAVIHGCGKYLWPDGRTFCGQYAEDQKEGFGVFTWKDGRRFDGWWHHGKQHGCGITYRTNGEIIKQGIWNMGRPPESPPEVVPEAAQNAPYNGSDNIRDRA